MLPKIVPINKKNYSSDLTYTFKLIQVEPTLIWPVKLSHAMIHDVA